MAAARPNVWDVWKTLLNGEESEEDTQSDEDVNNVEENEDSESDVEVPEIASDEDELADPSDADTDENDQDIEWSETFESIDISPFIEASGPQIQLDRQAKEIDVFKCFFTDEMLHRVVEETNMYANYKQQTSGRDDPTWKETSVSEMSSFLGILILMGIVKVPDYKHYWSSNKYVTNVGVKDIMPKSRYEKLNQYLHLNDSTLNDDNDKLYKVRPLLDSVANTCSSSYKPQKCQSIDEGMIPYKGRFASKQYMPSKPVKWGIKVWMRCDSVSGFCHQLDIYLGKNHCPKDGKGLPYHVVTNLTRDLIGKAHHVYCDSYFTSVQLAKDLLHDDIYMCGTIRQNRKQFPSALQSKNLQAPLDQGQYAARQTDCMVAITWMDKRHVSVLATNESLDVVDMVDRKRKDGSNLRIARPRAISNYQQHFRGVDICDQLRAKYPVGRSSKKWWRCIMYFLINICIVNAFLVFQELVRSNVIHQTANKKRYTQLDFRLNLIGQLVNGFSCISKKKKSVAPTPLGNDNSEHNFGRLSRKRSSCKHCPKFGAKKRKDATTGCITCDKHFCCMECHRAFHTSVGIALEE